MQVQTSAHAREGVRAKGQHSSASEDWGTDPHIIVLGRRVCGRFDVDPSSSPKWNQIIGAKRIITKREDGRKTPWVLHGPTPRGIAGAAQTCAPPNDETAIVNPPGDPKGANVALFWSASAGYFEHGWLSSVLWIGFSVEQLSRLQRVGAASHPLEHVTCIPDNRQKYCVSPGVKGEQPGHASFITLLPRDRAQARLFVEVFSELGHVVVGDRWRR